MARFHRWRMKNMSERGFITLLSFVVGIFSGLAAVIIKNAVRFTQRMVDKLLESEVHNYIYFALPIFGIFLTVIIVKYVVRHHVRHGIPTVWYFETKREDKKP